MGEKQALATLAIIAACGFLSPRAGWGLVGFVVFLWWLGVEPWEELK